MKEEKFVVRAYGKSELAMMYFPKDSQETATNKFRNWLRINPRLKGFIDRSSRCYTPKQVRRIIEEVGEPFSTE